MKARWGVGLTAILVLAVSSAQAEEVIDLDALEAEEVRSQAVIDLDEPEQVDIDVDVEVGEPSGPVVAGQMTEAAARAKKLFDHEHWLAAAQALQRVVSGATGDDPGNRQLAEYYLAISLYRMKLYTASSDIFVRISHNVNHLKFKETLLWLAKLATQLPHNSLLAERVCSYNDRQVLHFDNAQQRDLYWQLNKMCAHVKLKRGDYAEAVRYAKRVEPQSEYYGPSRVIMARAYYALGKPAAARRVLTEAIEHVPKAERATLRQVSRYLENQHAEPTSTWRNPALMYWRQRGFSSSTSVPK